MLPSITTIYGEPGSIKSSLAISWPRPIAFYNLEGGGPRAWGYKEGIDEGYIVERLFELPHRSMTTRYEKLTGYTEIWKALTSSMEMDLHNFETVVWDTGTVVWALDRDAWLQDIQKDKPNRKQLLQIEYGEPNRRITELFNLARAFQTNLVVTHHETDEYMQLKDPLGRPILDDQGDPVSVTTGRKQPEGFKHTIALSDWVLRTSISDTGVPKVRVEKSGYGLHMRGREIEWPTYALLEEEVSKPVETSSVGKS